MSNFKKQLHVFHETEVLEEFEKEIIEEGKIGQVVNAVLTFLPATVMHLGPWVSSVFAGLTMPALPTMAGLGAMLPIMPAMPVLPAIGLAGTGAATAITVGAVSLPVTVALVIMGTLISAGIITKDVAIKKMKYAKFQDAVISALKDPKFMKGVQALKINFESPSDRDKKKIIAFAKKYKVKGK